MDAMDADAAAPAPQRSVTIPTSTGESVVITSEELLTLDQKEVIDLLVSEKAPISVWHAVMMEYWRLRRVDSFDDLLRRALQEKPSGGAWHARRLAPRHLSFPAASPRRPPPPAPFPARAPR